MKISVYKDKALKGGHIAPKGNSIVICSQRLWAMDFLFLADTLRDVFLYSQSKITKFY